MDRCDGPLYNALMAQTVDGAIKIAAKKAGLSEIEYRKKVDAGQKWCVLCRAWHPTSKFGVDRSRWDGLASSCLESRRRDRRDRYCPKARPAKGRSFVPARDGDKLQARRRVNYFVEAGLLPPPNNVPCVDCGHEFIGKGNRHEYDHYKGYAAQHHEDVEAVCKRCHVKREETRSGSKN